MSASTLAAGVRRTQVIDWVALEDELEEAPVEDILRVALGAFAPNRLLEITPEFLETVLLLLKEQDYDIVTLDEADGVTTMKVLVQHNSQEDRDIM